MPHLQYLGRYWLFGSDDLPLFLTFSTLVRLTWIIICVMMDILHFQPYMNESNYSSLIIFIEVSIILFGLLLFLEFLLIQKSFIGTVINYSERSKQVTWLLNIRGIFLFCQLIVGIFGIIIISHISLNTFHNLYIIYNFIEIIGFILLYYLFSFNITNIQLLNRNETYELWKLRFLHTCKCISLITCNIMGQNNQLSDDLEQIASLLTDLLHHEGLLDIVFTDIVIGIILLSHRQYISNNNNVSNNSINSYEKTPEYYQNQMEKQELLNIISNDENIVVEDEKAADLYRYSIYSGAVYSYLLRIYVSFFLHCFSV